MTNKLNILYIVIILFLIASVSSAETQTDTTTIYHLDPIVVTGSKVEITRKNVPLTVSVISEEDIQHSGESALLPILSDRIPGMFVTERSVTGFGVAGGSAGKISVRGIGGSPNTQVLMLIDGHPQFMGIFGHPLPDAYVSSDAERVEVIRGPASILYGTGAMGGVINIITKKQKIEGLTMNGRVSYGSHNTQKYSGSGGWKMNKFNLFASINHDKTDGHRENSQFKITNGYVKSGYELNRNFSLMSDVSLAKFKSYDPGPASSPYTDEEHWVDITRGKAALSLENRHNTFEGGLKLFYNFGEHDIYDGFHSNDENYGVMFYQGVKLLKDNVITVGVDYKNYGGKAENTNAMGGQGIVFADTTVSEIGVYTFVQQKIKQKLTLNAGLRLENHSTYETETVPQIGFAFHANSQTTLKGSASRGFRSPTIRELYLWDAANPDLEPERMWNYELGVLQTFANNRLSLELTGFISEGENLIQVEGQYPNVQNKNSGEFSHKGVELQAQYAFSQNLRFNANYSYLDMETPVTSAPEHQLFFEIDYRYGMFNLNTNVQHISSLYTSLENDETQDYTLLNAGLTITPTHYLEFFINGENLLDETYEINYDYPMPGATVFAGINIKRLLY